MQEALKFDFTTAPDPVLFDESLVASYDDMLDADCDEDCDLDCSMTVSVADRRAAHDAFRGVPETRVAQNLHLCACIELKHRTVDTDDDIIEQTAEFWLGGGDGDDDIKVKVCKTFFAHTLGLPDSRLEALLEPHTFEWFSRHRDCGRSFGDRDSDDCGNGDVDDDGDYDDDYEHRRRRYAVTTFGDNDEIPCSDFVLNSRKHLNKNNSAFVEETDSDVEVYLDEIPHSVYNNVIRHIQTIPRVVSTWISQENKQETLKFECSINCRSLYLNYLKKSKKIKNKVNEKQFKKIYNRYVKKSFMV
ncbi:uncharacterized protein LOC132952322 [Metopolophium dirhodum]|uniref:uncharacterized protein LOC132952322 n=1 Tax=Metopolophium dirhodum TaxID=44670 RepID=UPI00298F7542|nr:uncharacterized protein LOC132952322 [Metopolophium dirhodum]XP_060880583.1 uncharacterized protein LOC132952322 [Metopolophium dirhodum]XP_060880584.1 uncharacterized protein LOC132952322 [Metopolophium dirhodum]